MDWNVRIIKPALTRSTSAIATCTTTSALRTRCRSRLTLVGPARALPSAAQSAAPCISAPGSIRTTRSRAATARPRMPTFAHPLRFHSAVEDSPGRWPAARARRRTRGPLRARRRGDRAARFRPDRPRMIRAAARAERRTHRQLLLAHLARTSSRFVTFAQAMSITRPMVAITTHSTSVTPPITSCFERTKGWARFSRSRRLGDSCRVRRATTASRSGSGAPRRRWPGRS